MNDTSSQVLPAVHGGLVYRAAREWGVSPDDILDFSANINPLGPPEEVVRALAAVDVRHYPDLDSLVAELARKYDLSPDRMIVGNGTAALLGDIVRAIRPRRALLVEPAFAEYRRVLGAADVDQRVARLDESAGFLPDFDLISYKIKAEDIDLVVLNTPHNPTGAAYDPIALRRLIGKHRGVRFLIDEAFADYTPEISLTGWDTSPLIVLRSLTKFYAMPGIRVGLAVANADTAGRVRRQVAAWPVGIHAIAAALAAISASDYEERTRRDNLRNRTDLAVGLTRLGVRVFPGAANFLLVKFSNRHVGDLARHLAQHHILIRECTSFTGLGEEFARLAVRSAADNARLIRHIGEWLGHRASGARS